MGNFQLVWGVHRQEWALQAEHTARRRAYRIQNAWLGQEMVRRLA